MKLALAVIFIAAAAACIVTRIVYGNRDWTAIGVLCASFGFLFFQLHRRDRRASG